MVRRYRSQRESQLEIGTDEEQSEQSDKGIGLDVVDDLESG